MAVNLKTATPDTTLPAAGFLFGADSQSASAPSVYPMSALISLLFGSTAFSGDTVTANKPLFDLTQTWDNAAVAFTADRINVTNTASNAASLLFDRQVGGASMAAFRVDGALVLNSNVVLTHDAANVLSLRNGANAQAFNVYNTYTDASNYERGVFDWSSSANVLTIGTAKAGTGSARNLRFLIGGVNKLDFGVTNAGHWTFAASSNGIYSLGIGGSSTGGMTVTNGNFGAPYGVPTITCINAIGADIVAPGTAFSFGSSNTLKFGGATSSFPALKRSSTALQARLADDSGFTFIQGKHQTDAAYVATPQTNTGYITMYDSTGTAYKVMVAA